MLQFLAHMPVSGPYMASRLKYKTMSATKTNHDTISITPSDFEDLKLLYADAVKNNKNEFTFKGKAILTSYAKYLIEYLTSKFSKK